MHVSQYTSDELLVLVYIQECTALFLMCAQCDQMCLVCYRMGVKVQEISETVGTHCSGLVAMVYCC